GFCSVSLVAAVRSLKAVGEILTIPKSLLPGLISIVKRPIFQAGGFTQPHSSCQTWNSHFPGGRFSMRATPLLSLTATNGFANGNTYARSHCSRLLLTGPGKRAGFMSNDASLPFGTLGLKSAPVFA